MKRSASATVAPREPKTDTSALLLSSRVMRGTRLVALSFALVLPGAVFAQAGREPQADAARIQQPPVIDGRLTETFWEGVPAISDFRQKDPEEGAAATETTHVRIAYDNTRVYIAVNALDSDVSQIRASELRRDNNLDSDDSFAVLLDTFHDHRNGFVFRVNPRGTRFDGLVRNESRFINAEWDEQWAAAAVIHEGGWSAEIAIPFKILRFSSAKEQVWGLNFERAIKRKNEFAYWSGWGRSYQFTNVSQAGQLAGISGIRQEDRLRIRPYLLTRIEDFNAVSRPNSRTKAEFGIDDLKFSITSNLTADLTVNPDFAQTEVDAQQVNLTRFSLFFPEKRQFFIEGAESLRMGVGLLHFGPPPIELFYSRNIGLSAGGEPVPVLGGGKLTGKAGGFDVGFLSVSTDRQGSAAGENFTVGRLRKEVLARSYVGAIFTNRQGGGRFTRILGGDGRFVFNRYLNVMGMFAKSISDNQGRKTWARQAGIEWRDDRIEAGINYINIDPDFRPGIGYVRRYDRLIGQRVSFKPRPKSTLIRQFEITPSNVHYHGDSGLLLSRQSQMQFNTAFQKGDRIEMTVSNNVERLQRGFEISRGVPLPAGLYQWNEARLTARTFNGRRFSGNAGVTYGGFYSGIKRTVDTGGEWRPNKNLSFNPTYAFNNVDLVEGSFNTHLFGLRSNLSFTTNLLTSTYLQYNSAGQLGALQVRLNYIFRSIDNFFIVYNETRYVDGVFEDRANRSLVFKVTYSIHR